MNLYTKSNNVKKSEICRNVECTSVTRERKKKEVAYCFDPLVLYLSASLKYKDNALCMNISDNENFAVIRFLNCMHLVVTTAKAYLKRGYGLLDLVEMGNIGLLEASENFEETSGCPFSVYAVWWIRQSIIKGLAENRQVHMLARASLITKEVIQNTIREELNEKIIEAIFSLVLHELINKILLHLFVTKKDLLLKFGITGRCPLTLYEKNEVLNCVQASIQHILQEGELKSCEWCEFNYLKLYA